MSRWAAGRLVLSSGGQLLRTSSAWLLRFVGRKRLRFTYLTGSLSGAAYDAMAAKPGWAKAAVEVAPALRLRGLVRRANAKGAPWLLFFPGNDAAQLQSGQEFLARLASEHDWGLALFAYRGYDGSDGAPFIADLARDAPVILRGLRETEAVRAEQLHVLGFSIGGHLAVHAAAASAERGEAVASLSLLNPVNDIIMLRRSRFQRLAPGDDLQTEPLLAALPAPVLIVQGGADEALGGSTQGLAIAQALGARARFEELPGVGHQQLLAEEAMFERVRAFVTLHAN